MLNSRQTSSVSSDVYFVMKKPILIIVAILVVLVGIRTILSMGGADDKALVKAALKESIEASKDGRPGGVMDKISDKLTVNKEQVASMSQIAKWIRDSKPDVTVTQQEPIILENEARITSPVTIKASFPGGVDLDKTIDGVTLIFAKESAMDYFIIPTKKWRLKEVLLPSDVMAQLSPY